MPKASNFYQSDRPESGGADKDGIREKNGLLAQQKQRLAQDQAEKDRSVPDAEGRPPESLGNHDPFSVGNEPNNARRTSE